MVLVLCKKSINSWFVWDKDAILYVSIYSALYWLKSLFFIDALMLQNLLFVASQICDSQFFFCVTPSGIAIFVIMSWHMLCGWSLNVVHFVGSISLHGQIVWHMMWLILLILHSSWLSIKKIIFCVAFFPRCTRPTVVMNCALLGALNCCCNCWMSFSCSSIVFVCTSMLP